MDKLALNREALYRCEASGDIKRLESKRRGTSNNELNSNKPVTIILLTSSWCKSRALSGLSFLIQKEVLDLKVQSFPCPALQFYYYLLSVLTATTLNALSTKTHFSFLPEEVPPRKIMIRVETLKYAAMSKPFTNNQNFTCSNIFQSVLSTTSPCTESALWKGQPSPKPLKTIHFGLGFSFRTMNRNNK